jgi:hypothetical protein
MSNKTTLEILEGSLASKSKQSEYLKYDAKSTFQIDLSTIAEVANHQIFINKSHVITCPKSEKIEGIHAKLRAEKNELEPFARLKRRFVAAAVDTSTGENGYLCLKRSVREFLVAYLNNENESAVELTTVKKGSGLHTTYTCISCKPVSFSSDLDTSRLIKEENEELTAIFLQTLKDIATDTLDINAVKEKVSAVFNNNSNETQEKETELVKTQNALEKLGF